jgi:ABC-2 type transport system ATP-binding protein
VDHALELDGVSKRFGATTAVDGLDLRLEPGAFVGLLGRNGAGKTTTIRMATGLIWPSSGRVRVLGLDIEAHALEVKRRIGVMPQEDGLLDCLTGRQYLDFVGRVYGLDAAEVERRTDELWQVLELVPGTGTLVREYSYGMKKKLALCAALVHDPEVVFLDEPFEGIDPVASRAIKDILRRLQHKGVTVLMSSHVLEVVERLCPRVAILDRGRLLGLGTVDELRARHGGAGNLEELFVELTGGARRSDLSWL